MGYDFTGVKFSIFLLILAWALQQCSASRTEWQTDGNAISITERLLRNAPKKLQRCYNSSICPHWTYFHKTRFRAYICHIIVTSYIIYSKFCISQLSVFDSVRDIGIGANLYKLLWAETSPSLPLLTSPPLFLLHSLPALPFPLPSFRLTAPLPGSTSLPSPSSLTVSLSSMNSI